MRPLNECEETTDCPTCLEKAGSPCRTSGPRAITKAPHVGRINAWHDKGVVDGSIRGHAVEVPA